MALTIDLKGKIALITGVTSGIGLGIAKMMAKAGCTVIGCAEHSEASEAAQHFLAEMEALDANKDYFRADMVSTEDIETLVSGISSDYGRLDILVSNAGQNVFKGLANCTENDWQFNLDLNLSAHWRLAKRCRPLFSTNNGTIIMMVSNHAFASIPGCAPYNIAKTALTGLVRSLAIEWGPNIRTVGIAPGFIDTPGNQEWFNSFTDPDQERQRTVALHPVKKLGTVEEIGAWCVFLSSDYAGFASGVTYLIDGGRSALMQDT
ncbi:SDR family NAD(P)-dependent oxidoreductase [Pedobacter miscanthi]|jgi:NAD(P)-dependent dehydrogenase (short-subunit alcohol dehydrogenase family)|uniref:SDR family NAD(P)-dependent oxidoreductase n=1 Tax=Pedobacter miscanthi TaxID=2259170 RepID=UPI00292CACE4|nr:SDR family oxidoreductase [Pedobacter miscanthi]